MKGGLLLDVVVSNDLDLCIHIVNRVDLEDNGLAGEAFHIVFGGSK